MSWIFQPLLPAAAMESTGGSTYALDAETAGFAVAGQSAAFNRDYALRAGPGFFQVNGAAASIDDGGSGASQNTRPMALDLSIGL